MHGHPHASHLPAQPEGQQYPWPNAPHAAQPQPQWATPGAPGHGVAQWAPPAFPSAGHPQPTAAQQHAHPYPQQGQQWPQAAPIHGQPQYASHVHAAIPGAQPAAAVHPGGQPVAWPSPDASSDAPEPNPPATVAAAGTGSRTRWLRIAGALVGVALLAFASWNLLSNGLGKASPPAKGAGIETPTPDPEPATSDAATDGATDYGFATDGNASAGTAPGDTGAAGSAAGGGAAAAAPVVKAAPTALQRRAAARRKARRAARLNAKRRAAAAAPAALVATDGRATPANIQAARGGGAASLPYTGASEWIAALLGILLLGSGLYLRRNAVEVVDTASMYQRGPLLRPRELRVRAERSLQQHGVAGTARIAAIHGSRNAAQAWRTVARSERVRILRWHIATRLGR